MRQLRLGSNGGGAETGVHKKTRIDLMCGRLQEADYEEGRDRRMKTTLTDEQNEVTPKS